ncbi:RNA-directed DNA polymerase, eukaryota, Reverse transcriptase zinc-binding domain protein [Artemisia annua]|uniref:RNA-directed DNA polymerase, eukaryota, Reverse transcriptase zinc-binding domain protein n=1 Tax=Artemisia annua TaxID=35608 RepID=A0A2U1NPK4_ARTAN|nr:RNA-directed DNA polymerase, eukaryota, Reverse transcriptase zinc-binding domain protein [Artemisia annua]
MLAKWWWRFLQEENALWRKVIVSIHGPHGGLATGSISSYKSAPWYQIMKLKDDLLSYGISLPSLFKRKIGNGLNTKFWLDSWIGGPPLCNVFPRLYLLDKNSECLVCERAPLNVPASANIDAPDSLRVFTLGPRATSPTAIELSDNSTLPMPRGVSFAWEWFRPLHTTSELQEYQDLKSGASLKKIVVSVVQERRFQLKTGGYLEQNR